MGLTSEPPWNLTLTILVGQRPQTSNFSPFLRAAEAGGRGRGVQSHPQNVPENAEPVAPNAVPRDHVSRSEVAKKRLGAHVSPCLVWRLWPPRPRPSQDWRSGRQRFSLCREPQMLRGNEPRAISGAGDTEQGQCDPRPRPTQAQSPRDPGPSEPRLPQV